MTKNKLPVSLNGTIKHFQGVGRSLGYPTANISIETNLDDGVYFGNADLMQYTHYPCLIFIGTPTTVGATDRRVEAHLLDIPDKDYYGEHLKLRVEKFHRSNETFQNVKILIQKMLDDEAQARKWFDHGA